MDREVKTHNSLNHRQQRTKQLAKRLVAMLIVAMVISSSLIGTVQVLVILHLAEVNRNTSIRNDIQNLTPILKSNLWTYEIKEVASIADAFLRNPYVAGVKILNDDTKTLEIRGQIHPQIALTNSKEIDVTEVSHDDTATGYIFQKMLVYNKHREKEIVGYIQIYSPNHLIYQNIKNDIYIVLAILVAALVFLSILVFQIQQHLVSIPILNLTKLIKKLTNELDRNFRENLLDYGLLNRHDEIGELARSYHLMWEKLRERDNRILEHRKNLESIVEERTTDLRKANIELEDSIQKLEIARDELVESEKMSALGILVSGVAHEVNTPLGVCVTATSHLINISTRLTTHYETNQLTQKELATFLSETNDSLKILDFNIHSAAKLIKSFKQIAVDQASEEIREINIREYLDEVLISMKPKFKGTKVVIETDFDDEIYLSLYPGALAQITSNLLMNALQHAFDDGTKVGKIKLNLFGNGDWIQLSVTDNGKGMSPKTVKKIFDPFYTTRRGNGGMGLGMHIVYNLVTQRLKGKISCNSKLEEGTVINIMFPIQQ